MIYNFYFILKLIIYFFDIYFYFFLDILYNCKLSYISDFLYVNTNLDFFFNKLYIKFALYKDVAYSWIRFPIKNSLLVNNEQLIFQNYESSSTKLKSKFKGGRNGGFERSSSSDAGAVPFSYFQFRQLLRLHHGSGKDSRLVRCPSSSEF